MIPAQGDWLLRFEIAGPVGTGTVSIPVRVSAR
jgi:hypothetical protein